VLPVPVSFEDFNVVAAPIEDMDWPDAVVLADGDVLTLVRSVELLTPALLPGGVDSVVGVVVVTVVVPVELEVDAAAVEVSP
jgi:hypothetical protein